MKLALGIPHAPWIEGRLESFARLAELLDLFTLPHDRFEWTQFSDKESNRSWARKLWMWAASTDAEWILQLQDDVIVPPFFWPALRAMLANFPHDCIGLEAAHPAGPLLAQQGHRWYRTRAWVVGVGWVLRRTVVEELLKWDGPAELNEDDYLGAFLNHTGRDAYHPIPTIIDHDTSVPSAYMNDGHQLRRPSVLWHNYPEAALTSPDFWKVPYRPTSGPPGDGHIGITVAYDVPMLMSPYIDVCWFCLGPKFPQRAVVQSQHTAAMICGPCIGRVTTAMLSPRKVE